MREKMSTSLDSVKKAVLISIIMLLLCGLGYPLLLTGVANTFFPSQAKGSLVEVDGKAVGSPLVGQDFTEAYFMKCRPSSVNYNTYTKEQAESGAYGGVASGSNNFAPSNPALVARVEADMEAFL
ncbi:MAG: potassium-transporting ATPase subunit C, partial [Anaerovoracaceae bacterium]